MEKRSLAAKKGQETRRRKQEEQEAARLAMPPVSHEDAYWRHWKKCPHPQHSPESRQWIKDNPWFEFQEKLWRRTARPMRSNSGKHIVGWNVDYTSQDGVAVEGARVPPNRRNDPLRNWGLPE
jgi:hypothetical protein